MADTVRQLLQSIKNLACGVAARVDGQTGPIADPDELEWVKEMVIDAAGKADAMLHDVSGPLYTPPGTWLTYEPVHTTGLNLNRVASAACEEACRAFELYCSGRIADACEAVWRGLGLASAVIDRAMNGP